MRLLQLDPVISITFASDNTLKILANSKYMIVNGMFDLVKEKLVLTTLMSFHNRISVSCTYYLADLKTHESYLLFF
jgi:hypothetical protein